MNRLGAKLTCATCGAQVIVIKPGSGEVRCHGAPMGPVVPARPAPPA